MKLHIVSGFLGSGKTTAIIMAARSLMSKGKIVGVITNDQGKYLVDTAFFKLDDIPTVEVTGGCFCCNYDDLDTRLDQLIETAHPDVIFAESVGSCADIVATVVKPLMRLRPQGLSPQSFSVFSDVRLLQMRLEGEELPFSDNVIYIFDKQIEEAGLLVINKKDLIPGPEADAVFNLAREKFPKKTILLQNSLISDDIHTWLDMLETNQLPADESNIEIDYRRYGEGEAQLAWFDGVVCVSVPENKGQGFIRKLVEQISLVAERNNAPIGHLKFLIKGSAQEIKVSIPTIRDTGWKEEIPFLDGTQFVVSINARIEMEAYLLQDQIRQILQELTKDTDVTISVSDIDYFHPKFPNPTHRIS
jgi:Ni2+-binding GTPase involved in maturation of urease and hydrogenase